VNKRESFNHCHERRLRLLHAANYSDRSLVYSSILRRLPSWDKLIAFILSPTHEPMNFVRSVSKVCHSTHGHTQPDSNIHSWYSWNLRYGIMLWTQKVNHLMC